jgi:DNA-binding NarL/FixJ family response regulator
MNKKSARTAKIIIADDHPIFRGGLNMILKNQSFVSKVAEAADGGEVISILAKESYDVVLMDIKMEPMSGIDATEIIQQKYPSTKVIALSMHDDEKNILDIISKGASGYLLKNADKEEIIEAIKEVMEGRQYFSREVSTIMLDRFKAKPVPEEDLVPKDRMREIVFLICHECTSQEIAEILYLSVRTIETYRSHILKVTKSKNLVGLMKFAEANDIMDDKDLKLKFSKALSKRNKN